MDVTSTLTSSTTTSTQPSSTIASKSTDTTSVSSSDISASPSDSNTSSTSVAASTATSSPSSTPTNSATADPSRQPSSIRYLVPVFLIILITLGGWIFQKYRKRKALREEQESRSQRAQRNEGGWKELKHDDDYDDPWDVGDDDPLHSWREKDLHPSLSRDVPVISVAGKGWGWRDSFRDWKSARGKENGNGAERLIGFEEMGERTTMKLVTRNLETYQTLPNPSGPFADDDEVDQDGERGSIRALRDKIASLSYASPSSSPHKGKLERNRSPNKRMSQREADDVPLDPPAWIRPRAVSPTSQILSPPLHPHLFFHPTTSVQSIHGLMGHTQGQGGHQHIMTEITEDQSGSEYGSDDGTATIISKDSRLAPVVVNTQATAQSLASKFPRIPSTASGLAGADSYSVVANAKIAPVPRSKLNGNSIGKGAGQKETPSLQRNSTTTPTSTSKLNPSAAARGSPSEAKTSAPLALRRSTAIQNLSKTRPSPRSPGLLSPTSANANPSGASSGSPRKTRVQRKEQKARDKVEDILKASWSDRALTSPPLGGGEAGPSLAQQLGGTGSGVVPGMMSPGLEKTGGIEQRLAMLRRVEI
ncbi:hypothetical protein CI109_106454 [Kwoniella shandongensis]|uniref:Uncharacterized protein n=1 Tax=Kwoniella shandongensis TaxID=1734106 RepID=A0AAJ8LRI3_9TREE